MPDRKTKDDFCYHALAVYEAVEPLLQYKTQLRELRRKKMPYLDILHESWSHRRHDDHQRF